MRRPKRTSICLLSAAACLTSLAGGCSLWQLSSASNRPLVVPLVGAGGGEGAGGEETHARALEQLERGNLAKAERLVEQSLVQDPDFGAAHNTLGKIRFDQRRYYQAAWEFEHAVAVLPGRPEPINNLGLVLERVGRLDRAVEQFEMAWAQEPDNPVYLGNLVRARIRRGDSTSELLDLLQRLVDLDSRADWVAWARERLNTGRMSRFGNVEVNPVIEALPENPLATQRDPNQTERETMDPDLAAPQWENLTDGPEEVPPPVETPFALPGKQ